MFAETKTEVYAELSSILSDVLKSNEHDRCASAYEAYGLASAYLTNFLDSLRFNPDTMNDEAKRDRLAIMKRELISVAVTCIVAVVDLSL